MSTQERLTTAELAAFWRVRKTSLSRWRSQGRAAIGERDSEHAKAPIYYPFIDLDAYHRERLHPCYTDFPTTEELWRRQQGTGRPALLTVPEVAARLQVSEGTILKHIREGLLPATKPFGDWLVPVMALGALIMLYDTRSSVSLEHAHRITGLRPLIFVELSKGDDPVIKRADVLTRRQETMLDKQSFLAFLSRRLVNCSVDRWYAMRFHYNYEPLLTADAVSREFHTNPRRFRHLMEPHEGNWPYFRALGGHVRIPRHVVANWAEANPRWQTRRVPVNRT